MRGINRKSGYVALAALAGLLSVQSARATALPYSTGFETTDGFNTGAISGQSGWTNFTSNPPTPSSTAIIVTNPTTPTGGVQTGTQSLQITREASEELGTSPTFSQTISNTTVGVSVNIDYTASSAYATADGVSPPFGPFFGIKVNGGGGAFYLGGFGIDATTGQLLLDDGSGTFPDVIGSLHGITPGTFGNYYLTVTNNGTNIVLSAYYNNAFEGSVDSVVTAAEDTTLTQAYLYGGAGSGDESSEALTGNAFFDNYSVAVVVPEPASMALMGVVLVGLLGRRSRREAVVAL